MTRPFALVAVLGGGLLAAAPAGAQAASRTVRFEVVAVGDSTFTFSSNGRDWVARGQRGIVVEPRRRDALIARFVVMMVDRGVATALVTGEVTRVNAQHAVLLEQPPTRFYTQRTFWLGAVAGAALGVLAGAAF